METGPTNAVYNLVESARQVLNFYHLGKIKLCASRKRQLEEIAGLSPTRIEEEA